MDKMFSGAVLCGGKSKRMGRDKASVVLGGKTFLEIQLEKLRAAGIQELMVSCAQGKIPEVPEDVRAVEDLAQDKGPLAAIASVLSASPAEWCIILSVDAIGVRPETVRTIMHTAADSSSDIVILASPGGIQPLIGAYRKTLAAAALELVNSGRLAVRSLFDGHPPLLLELPEDSPELLNCNTPEDLEKLLTVIQIREND